MKRTSVLLFVERENVNCDVLDPSLCEDGVWCFQKHWKKYFHVRHCFFQLIVVLVIHVLMYVCVPSFRTWCALFYK